MARAGPKKKQRYGIEFKRAAVQLSHRPGLQVQAVAEALDIHPFMMSRWRKESREGRLRPRIRAPERRAIHDSHLLQSAYLHLTVLDRFFGFCLR